MSVTRAVLASFLFAAFCTCVSAAAEGEAPEADEAEEIRALADYTVNQAATLPGNRLTVMPFTYLDGGFSVEGRLLADLLHMTLAATGKVELLERERLAAIAQEHKLGAMGMLDASSAPRLGKIAGVDGFVFGRCVDMGHKLQLALSLVGTDSKVIAEKTFLLTKRIKTPTTPLWEDIRKIKQQNGETFRVRVWTDKPDCRVGDKVVIRFWADRNCYVTIFNMGTTGQITVLFPNRFYATNYVKKGETYSIPGPHHNFSIAAQGPPGVEKLKILATTANVPLLPSQYNVSAFRSLDPKQPRVTRDLAVTLSKLDRTAWAEATHEFLVAPKLDAQ